MGISVSPTESPFLDVPPNPPSHYSPHTATRSMTPHNICGSASGDIENAISSDSHDDSSIGNPVDLDVITQTPLQLGETLIIYHPHSQHPPEVINTALLSLTHEPQHPLFVIVFSSLRLRYTMILYTSTTVDLYPSLQDTTPSPSSPVPFGLSFILPHRPFHSLPDYPGIR